MALVIVGGAGGFGLAKLGGGDKQEPSTPPTPSLLPFEATQLSINKAKFDGDLAPIAERWLSRMGGCAIDTELGGPILPADEERHVFCRYGGISVHFALFKTVSEKEAARTYRQQLNLAGGELAPGLEEPKRTTGGASGAAGHYIEYAFAGGDGRTICGVWWDRDESSAAFYLETLCEAGIGGNWDALRDLWQRHS